MVVEPAFSDGHCPALRMLTQQLDVTTRIESNRVVWMDAGRIPYISLVLARDDGRRASGAEDIPGAAPRADADDRSGSRFLRALNYVAAVAVERRVCEVRVAVDVPFEIPVFLGHFLSIQRSVGPAM